MSYYKTVSEGRRKAAIEQAFWERAKGKRTGPRTPEGKRRIGQRGMREGHRSQSFKDLTLLIEVMETRALALVAKLEALKMDGTP
jgi:hypothetical protein